jgi:hypothetical protein
VIEQPFVDVADLFDIEGAEAEAALSRPPPGTFISRNWRAPRR